MSNNTAIHTLGQYEITYNPVPVVAVAAFTQLIRTGYLLTSTKCIIRYTREGAIEVKHTADVDWLPLMQFSLTNEYYLVDKVHYLTQAGAGKLHRYVLVEIDQDNTSVNIHERKATSPYEAIRQWVVNELPTYAGCPWVDEDDVLQALEEFAKIVQQLPPGTKEITFYGAPDGQVICRQIED